MLYKPQKLIERCLLCFTNFYKETFFATKVEHPEYYLLISFINWCFISVFNTKWQLNVLKNFSSNKEVKQMKLDNQVGFGSKKEIKYPESKTK